MFYYHTKFYSKNENFSESPKANFHVIWILTMYSNQVESLHNLVSPFYGPSCKLQQAKNSPIILFIYTKFNSFFSTIFKLLLCLWVNNCLKSWLLCLWELSSSFSYPLWPVCNASWHLLRVLLKNPLVYKGSGSDITLWVETLAPLSQRQPGKTLAFPLPLGKKGHLFFSCLSAGKSAYHFQREHQLLDEAKVCTSGSFKTVSASY